MTLKVFSNHDKLLTHSMCHKFCLSPCYELKLLKQQALKKGSMTAMHWQLDQYQNSRNGTRR